MKFKIDENLPTEIATDLRAAGHDAHTVDDESLAGSDDLDLMARVLKEQRVFLTMDKGIADVRVYPPAKYHGIVLFRPAQTGRLTVLKFVRRHLDELLGSDLAGRLFIVSDAGIRVRDA